MSLVERVGEGALLGRGSRLCAGLGQAGPMLSGAGQVRRQPFGEYGTRREAFRRAFSLNPDLPAGHSLYAQHQAERGRAKEAIVLLLDHIQRNQNDPELYAGLVHACRYGGLLEASLGAHELARRLDRNVQTTVMNTHFAMGNFQLALDVSAGEAGLLTSISPAGAMSLDALGRREEALEHLRRFEDKDLPPVMRLIMTMLKTFLEGNREQAVQRIREINLQAVDPEGFFYRARLLARLGATTEA